MQSEPPADSPQAEFLAPGARYLWEEHYGVTRYQDAKKDQWKWQTTCQQSPEKAIPNRFERGWLRVYTDRINPGRFHVWIIVDPALSKSTRADRTSIMALAGLRQNRLALVDWVLDWLDPDQRTIAMFKMAQRWEADAILYEEIGLMADTWYLNRDLENMDLHCPIIPVGKRGERHMLSKDARIAGLIPSFREGQIILPGDYVEADDDGSEKLVARFMYKQRDGHVVDLMDYFIESEYVPWSGPGSLAHDEGLDTLSRIHDPEFQIIYAEDDVADSEAAEERERDMNRTGEGRGQFEGMTRAAGSWFSRS